MSDVTAEPTPAPKTTLSITVDGRPHEAQPGQWVIDACEDAGTYVPRFCYHPRMSSVGMCRQCLVEIDGPRGPLLVVSCTTAVAEGQVVHTETTTVKRAQEGVLEMLLANHPLDCPVCDKGGECPLQDQAFSHGPGESRYVEEKRHFEKPIPISDLVVLDRERCVLCDRCTRFADEVAGDKLIHFQSRGNQTQVNTFPDEPFASYFSGNTVQICPVGALTSRPYRFKARPWDLDETESTCTTCSVGCRVVVQSSRDELVRLQGIDSDPVNWGWLCDRGRYDYEAVNSVERLESPLVKTDDGHSMVNWATALARAAELIEEAKAAGGAETIAVLGGARGTNEDAFAWARLAHDVIGTPSVYAQLGDGLPVGILGLPRATIDETAGAKTIILLGPDLKEELPVLYLRLRDSAVKRRSRILEITPKQTGLTKYAWRSAGCEPGTQPATVRGLLADPDVATQLAAGPVVIVAGRANLAESAAGTVEALQLLMTAIPGVKVLPALRRGNVVGALQLGMRPRPGGMDSRKILKAAAEGRIECLVLVGSDPIADFPDTDLARRALAGARRIVAVDTFLSESSRLADVVLAASAYGEKSGTTTNLEGRVTRVGRKVTPRGTTRADWMIASGLATRLGTDFGWNAVEDVTAEMVATVAAYAGVTPDALRATPDGVLAIAPPTIDPINDVASTPAVRNSYDFRLVVSRKLYDQAVGTIKSPSLSHLPPGAAAHLHPLDIERASAVAGADVTLTSPRGTLVLRAEPDESVLRGTVWVPFNQPGVNVGDIIDTDADVIDVRIENLWIALDPMLIGDLTLGDVLIVLLKVVVVFVIGLVATMLMVWFERKAIAGMQNRIGPNKAGPFGILQTLADGIKLFFKEDLVPDRSDRFVFKLAPYLAFVPAFLVWTVIPLGGDYRDGNNGIVSWFGHETKVQLADPPIGILLVLALSWIAVYGVMLAGWASGSKYPLLGSVRASAQMVSYEAALGLGVASVLLIAGTLSTSGIVAAQDSVSKWHIIATGILPFFIFIVAATAELNRPPFDLVEAEQELVGGFNTEYSSIRFALFFLAEFMNTITMSAIIVTLFFGGPQPVKIGDTTLDIPLIPNGLEGTVWFLLKLLVFLYVYVWLRATLPRVRYDQLMNLGWKVMIPVSLGWFMLLALFRLGQDRDWSRGKTIVAGAIGIAVLLVCGGLLIAASRVSAKNREREGAVF